MTEVAPQDWIEIVTVLNQYASALDTKDWQSLERVFTEDATGLYRDRPILGRATLISYISDRIGSCRYTQHLLGNYVVTSSGSGIESSCYFRAWHEGGPQREGLTFEVFGRYEDTWSRTGDGWRIAARRNIGLSSLGTVAALGSD